VVFVTLAVNLDEAHATEPFPEFTRDLRLVNVRFLAQGGHGRRVAHFDERSCRPR
jgi:hypothetical protein